LGTSLIAPLENGVAIEVPIENPEKATPEDYPHSDERSFVCVGVQSASDRIRSA
jgi:hypothetical protein